MGLFKEWGDPGNGEGDDSELGGGGGRGFVFMVYWTEACSEPWQILKIELFATIVNDWKSFILDSWPVSEYTSAKYTVNWNDCPFLLYVKIYYMFEIRPYLLPMRFLFY